MIFILIISISVLGIDGSDLRSKLTDPAWQDAISNGGMYIGEGRTKRYVQLNESQPNIAYQECILPDGRGGHCRHLHYCVQDDFKQNILKLTQYLCIIERMTVGVCCPDVEGPEGLAGDLPATAPLEESNDLLNRITRDENRGCGLSTRPHGRLFGAKPADPREWPWMASITPEGFKQYCGGVLITDRHVLTAAHCTRRWKAEELRVRLGEYDFQRTNDSRSYNFLVTEIHQHTEFELPSYHHDIAILKLNRPTVFNSYVWPICLPPPGLKLADKPAIIIGWGTQFYGGPHSDVLMEVSVPVWDQQKCIDAFVDSVFEESICAGGYEGGKDACQGDSGGPLMYQLPSGRWTIIGVVSWGIRCGEPNHPGIYTRVEKYLSWIVENVRF